MKIDGEFTYCKCDGKRAIILLKDFPQNNRGTALVEDDDPTKDWASWQIGDLEKWCKELVEHDEMYEKLAKENVMFKFIRYGIIFQSPAQIMIETPSLDFLYNQNVKT